MVLGIIGVVSYLGITTSQKGVEKAYRQYWYTGYSALLDATFDAGINGKLDSIENYAEHVRGLMNGTVTPNDNKSFTTPNGIIYRFYTKKGKWVIVMRIPTPNKKNQVPDRTKFVYDEDNSILYPAAIDSTQEKETPDLWINLQGRADLLPYRINDGLPNTNDSHEKDIYDFKTAYCKTHEQTSITVPSNGPYFAKVDCKKNDPKITGGILQLVNPRKVY